LTTCTITNADGLDASGFPTFRSKTPTVQAYFEVPSGSTNVTANILSGDWSKTITPPTPISGPAGNLQVAFPPDIPAGSYVLVVGVNGTATVWAYFSTGGATALVSTREILFAGGGAVAGLALGYGIRKWAG